MKILSLTGIKFNTNYTKDNVRNSNVKSAGTPCTIKLKEPIQKDTVSFGAKIPSIVTPTMEDLIKRTKAVDVLRFNVLRLARYDVPCPVCGHVMLDVDKFNAFEEKIMNSKDSKEILNNIGELKKYLHPVETKIFSIMRADNARYPERTLLEMLKIRLPQSETKIVQQQTKIFSNIGLLSRELPETERIQVQDLLSETFSRVLDPRETSRFSRRIFIDKLKFSFIPKQEIINLRSNYEQEFLAQYKPKSELKNLMNSIKLKSSMENYIDERLRLNVNKRILTYAQEKIMSEAVTLPAAYNNVDAFIVKYAKRNYNGADPNKKIALRMLSNSLATVEHIKPQSKRGATEPKNLGLECACDNNRRGSATIIEQIIENKFMPVHYKHYMKRLCQLHLNNIVEKSYITQQNKTYRTESRGILDADLQELRRHNHNKKYNKNDGITPTIKERRLARKNKLKNKKHKKVDK